jgi:hypothetical protein
MREGVVKRLIARRTPVPRPRNRRASKYRSGYRAFLMGVVSPFVGG